MRILYHRSCNIQLLYAVDPFSQEFRIIDVNAATGANDLHVDGGRRSHRPAACSRPTRRTLRQRGACPRRLAGRPFRRGRSRLGVYAAASPHSEQEFVIDYMFIDFSTTHSEPMRACSHQTGSIIEVNARLSRSFALASKATGYPLA